MSEAHVNRYPESGITISTKHQMGTVASLHVHSPIADEVIDLVWARLDAIERRFSRFIPDSEVSAIRSGRRSINDPQSEEMAEVLSRAAAITAQTDGWFTVGDGPTFDPGGYVKGWAAEQAVEILDDAGVTNAYLNLGGDIVLRGAPHASDGWSVGIRNPTDPAGTAFVLSAPGPMGIATSGSTERGGHIVDPNGAPVVRPGSVTIVGPQLSVADALATSIWAKGIEGLAWLDAFGEFGAVWIDTECVRWTPNLNPLVQPPATVPADIDPRNDTFSLEPPL